MIVVVVFICISTKLPITVLIQPLHTVIVTYWVGVGVGLSFINISFVIDVGLLVTVVVIIIDVVISVSFGVDIDPLIDMFINLPITDCC